MIYLSEIETHKIFHSFFLILFRDFHAFESSGRKKDSDEALFPANSISERI